MLVLLALDPHLFNMQRKSHSDGQFTNSQAAALCRWEDEGGAISAPANKIRALQPPLSEQKIGILQCLGAAVLSQWRGLPKGIQQELFKHSFDAVAPCDAAPMKRKIARFLHNHKTDAGDAK